MSGAQVDILLKFVGRQGFDSRHPAEFCFSPLFRQYS